MHSKKHLSFNSLIHGFRKIVDGFFDARKQAVDYSLTDAVLSGFACMYFQDPSLLQFQKRLESEGGRSNLSTLFGVQQVPESTQLRELIDVIPSRDFAAVFKEVVHRLQRGKHLEQYQLYRGAYLVSLDGTQYFTSSNVSCEHCLQKEHRSGEITFSHQVLQGAIVHPDIRQVIPLMVEDIRNEDGDTKQDCEINAGKRFVERLRKEHAQLDVIVLGDALYSKQPMIEQVIKQRMSYIFGVKPTDHKILYEYLAEFDELPELQVKDEKGKIYCYRWMNDVPLNGREDAYSVNFFELKILVPDKSGGLKINYSSSWVTNMPISEYSVERIVRSARCRWKIENECFNTLKNQGYHLEHNFGHGKHHLAFNFYQLTLIAFFFHQVFELTDSLFQQCRTKHGSKRHLWETLRSAIKLVLCDSWIQLLEFVLKPELFTLSPQPP